MSGSTFSYAQAARGHSAAHTSPQPASSPAPTSTSSHNKDDAGPATTLASAAPVPSTEADMRENEKKLQPDLETTTQKQDLDSSSTRESSLLSRAPSDQSAVAHRNGDSNSGNALGGSYTEEKGPRSASRASRSTNDSADLHKPRRNKHNKTSEKDVEDDRDKDEVDKELPKPAQLSEAPPPSVNIWQQRAQSLAKVKPAPSNSNPSPTVSSTPTVVSSEDAKESGTAEDVHSQEGQQNGVNGDRHSRKSTDLTRSTEQASRRSGPRGTRAAEKDEKAAPETMPSVADASLWPDPKFAASTEESRRKPHERVERAEKEGHEEVAQHKRQKDKWVAMPFVPTVHFQTPLPPRGGKSRGGARGGRDAGSRGAHSSATSGGPASGTSPTTDKTPATPGAAGGKDARQRDNNGPTRAASLPPNASKRASIDSAYAKEMRKPSVPSTIERNKDTTADSSMPASGKGDFTRADRSDYAPPSTEAFPYPGRASFSERRAESGFKAFDGFRDGMLSMSKDQPTNLRERGDGRSERGRGGYRGRGGHNSPALIQAPQAAFPQNGPYPIQALPGRQNGPYSPPLQQTGFGNAFGNIPTRSSGRGNGRANSASGGFSRGVQNGTISSKMAPINTNNIPYDYPIQPFPGYAFQPALWVEMQVLQTQVEYYFSIENLCKDFFIRKRMDSQGFVPLTVIANFNRMRELAPDVEAIRYACEQSDKLDYVVGDDNVERLRPRDKWESFVLSMDEREEEACNDGPARWFWRSNHSRSPYTAPMMTNGFVAPSPTMFPPNFPTPDQMYQPPPYMNGSQYEPGVNGGDVNGQRYSSESQLSAAVPEFSPSGPSPFGLEHASTFSDQKVEGLMMIVKYDKKDASKGGPHADSSPVVNGAVDTSEHLHTNGTARSHNDNELAQPKEVWTKQPNEKQSEKPSNEETPYPEFRELALEQRRSAQVGETPRAMKSLYEFWSDFLLTEFNTKMYEEFRNCALEDASKDVPSTIGLKFLLHYYNELLFSHNPKPWGQGRPVPEIFSSHYRDALNLDPSQGPNNDVRI